MVQTEEKPELEKINASYPGCEYWKWNPREGKDYPLGYHHGSGRYNIGGREVSGIFFGNIRGWNTFYETQGNRLFKYLANPDSKAGWITEEDSPSEAIVLCRCEGEVTNETEKVRILQKIEELKRSRAGLQKYLN